MGAEALTLVGLLERAGGSSRVGLRLLDRAEEARWSPWSDIAERARRVRGGLQALGVKPGDRVALVYPTSFEFVEAFFGVLLAGAVPVPLYPPVQLGRLDEYLARTGRMLEQVGVSLVLADRRVRRVLGQAVLAASPPLGCRAHHELPDTLGAPEKVGADDLALVQFSSGTTAAPHPVALTHRAVTAHVRLLNSLWPDRDGLVHSGVSWLPLYHDMGLIGCLFPALERPGTLTLIPPELFVARPAVWLRAVSRYRATISAAPNFAYGLCLDRVADEELEGVDLSSWRFALNGAEPVTPRVLRAFSERFAAWGLRPEALTPVYGLSEATLAVTFSALDRGFSCRCFDRERLARDGEAVEAPDGIEIVSAGRPLPGVRLRIVDADRNDRADAQVGRVLVKGPSLMAGYLGQAEATALALEDGWLDSGDLGFLLAGELYLTGRAKDVIILRGRNHSPHDLEAAVEAIDGVRRGCSVAVSHLPAGADAERLLLLVEARRGIPGAAYAALAEDCAAAVRRAVGLSPDLVEVLAPGTLPRTSSRKLRRAEALRRRLDGTLEPPPRVTPLRLAGSVVRSSLAMMGSERGRGRTAPGPRRRRARRRPS